MITLNVDNRHVTIKGAPAAIIRRLEVITSYKVAGAHFSPAYQAKRWDGREHLLKYSKKHGYRFPTGLLKDAIKELKRSFQRVEVISKTKGYWVIKCQKTILKPT
jgi:hypothetical protein